MNDLSDTAQEATEEWRRITHLGEYAAERYEVSNLGQVRSVDHVTFIQQSHRAYYSTFRGQLLALADVNGYRVATLRDGAESARMVGTHTLVLNAFVGPPPAEHECCHENGDSSDNRLGNLYWGTKSENQLDRVRHGHHPAVNRERCPQKHLLKMPNLEPTLWAKKRHRACKACTGTQTFNSHRRAKGRPTLDHKTESDRRYALIMAGEVVR